MPPARPTALARRSGVQLLLACGVAAVYLVSTNMFGPLVPLRAANLHAPSPAIGGVVAAGSLLPLVLALPGGGWTDGHGARRVLVPSLALVVCGTALAASAQGLGWLTAGVVLTGLGQFGSTLALQAFVAAIPGRGTVSAFSAFTVAVAVGGLVGPALAGAVATARGLPGALGRAAALAAAALLASLGLDGHIAAGSGRGVRLADAVDTAAAVLRTPAMATAVGANAALVFADILTASFYPVLLQQRGVGFGAVGLLISLRSLVAVAVRPTLPRAARRMSRWGLMAAAVVAEAAGTAVVPLSPAMALQIPAAALCGLAVGYSQPLSMAVVADHAPGASRGTALAVRLAANRAATLLSPLLVGLAIGALGLPAGFALAAAVPLAAVVAIARLPRREGHPEPAAEQAPQGG